MLEVQEAWDAGFKNPTGPRLRFVKLDDLVRPDGRFSRYRVYAEGAQEGTPYIFAVLKIGTSADKVQILSSDAYVNQNGLLLTRKASRENEDSETVGDGTEFDVSVQAADGEPIRLLLRSRDNKTMTPGTLVPFPIESLDKGCRLTALMAAPEAAPVLIYVDGFPANSDLGYESSSENELMKGSVHTDALGHGAYVELPFVTGKDAGVLRDSIVTKDCKVSVQIPWGKGSYHKH